MRSIRGSGRGRGAPLPGIDRPVDVDDVERLLDAFATPDGPRRAEEALRRLLGPPQRAPQRAARRWRRLVGLARRAEPEPLRALLAAGLVAAEACAQGGARAELPGFAADALLDLAGLLPAEWAALFVAAAEARGGAAPPAGPGAGGVPLLGPRDVGRYLLLEPLGRGAFGVVHRALDRELDRHVALKLLVPEAAAGDAQARMRAEARALGRLSHPGIAMLYEQGVVRDRGLTLPYLALELVAGGPLDAWAARHELSPHQRVALLVQACDALQHAHEQGVEHRDLHPGNLLVREDGSLKVVDFGAAGGGTTAAATRSALARGAAGFRSPEQLRGEVGDARSDVFALGAVLFHLLSGSVPYARPEPGAPGVDDWQRWSLRRLSSVRAQVDRDLDAICARALAPEPEERYPSARELGEDLRRWLRGLPVDARAPGLGQRLFVGLRQHRRGVAAGVGFALLVVATLAALGWWQVAGLYDALRATLREQVVAVVAAERHEMDRQGRAWHVAPFEALWRAHLDALTRDDPVLRADALELLAHGALTRDDYDREETLRREVLALRERARAERPDDVARRVALSKAHVRLGDVRWRELDSEFGGLQSSAPAAVAVAAATREHYEIALGLDQGTAAASDLPTHHDDLFWSHFRLARLELERGDLARNRAHLAAAERALERLLELDPERPHSQYARSHFLQTKAMRIPRDRRPTEGLPLLYQALDAAQAAATARPDQRAFTEQLATCLRNAMSLEATGSKDLESELQRQLEMFELLGLTVPELPTGDPFAGLLSALARLGWERGMPHLRAWSLQLAYERRMARRPQQPDGLAWLEGLGLGSHSVATAAANLGVGEIERALEQLEAALTLLASPPPEALHPLLYEAACCVRIGRPDGARLQRGREAFEQARELERNAFEQSVFDSLVRHYRPTDDR